MSTPFSTARTFHATQQQMICDSVQKILQDAGVSDHDAANVVNDLKKIAIDH